MTTKAPAIDRSAPADTFRLAYLAFFLQGVQLMLPFNAFFCAGEFFSLRFKSSPYAASWSTYFNFIYQIANLVFVTAAMMRQHRANFNRQILIGSVVNVIVFSGLCALVAAPAFDSVATFGLVIAMFCVASIVNAFLQNAFYAIASRWGPQYVQALCSGQGFASVATALVPLLIALCSDPRSTGDPAAVSRRTLLFFVPAASITFFAFVSYVLLRRHPLHYYHHRNEQQCSGVDDWGFPLDASKKQTNAAMPKKLNFRELITIALRIRGLVFANATCWIVSVALFPSITGNVTHVAGPGQLTGRWASPEVFPLLHYLISSAGDWFGRIVAGWEAIHPRRSRPLVVFSITRVFFVILFLLCNTETPPSGARLLPLSINSDAAFMSIVVLFAITNGWLSSVVFMAGPNQVETDEEKEAAGMAQSWFMTLGCFIGSFASFGVRAAVCRCNPFTS